MGMFDRNKLLGTGEWGKGNGTVFLLQGKFGHTRFVFCGMTEAKGTPERGR